MHFLLVWWDEKRAEQHERTFWCWLMCCEWWATMAIVKMIWKSVPIAIINSSRKICTYQSMETNWAQVTTGIKSSEMCWMFTVKTFYQPLREKGHKRRYFVKWLSIVVLSFGNNVLQYFFSSFLSLWVRKKTMMRPETPWSFKMPMRVESDHLRSSCKNLWKIVRFMQSCETHLWLKKWRQETTVKNLK